MVVTLAIRWLSCFLHPKNFLRTPCVLVILVGFGEAPKKNDTLHLPLKISLPGEDERDLNQKLEFFFQKSLQ